MERPLSTAYAAPTIDSRFKSHRQPCVQMHPREIEELLAEVGSEELDFLEVRTQALQRLQEAQPACALQCTVFSSAQPSPPARLAVQQAYCEG